MTKEAQCQHSRQCLADLETRGIAAMRRDDIDMAHGGRAEEALQTARGLVSNHIASFAEQLTHCNEPVQPSFSLILRCL